MQAHILGCGEAFDHELFNTSILLRATRATVLLDCGYSIPPRVWQACQDPNEVDAIWLSHQHADHFFGMPALLGRWWEEGRTKPLTILSQPSVLDAVREALELGYRNLAARFRYPLVFHTAGPELRIETHGLTLTCAESRHSVPNLAVRVEDGSQAVCYSGDGMFTDASRALFRGADLLLHEAFFFDESPVHADIGRLIDMAAAEGVKHLALVHVQRAVRRERTRIEAAIRGAGTKVTMPQIDEVVR